MRNAFAFIALSSAGIACFAAVDVVYFQTLGYSLAFIGLMAAAFNIALTAAELPFAVLFDRYSNKRALQIGNALREPQRIIPRARTNHCGCSHSCNDGHLERNHRQLASKP